MKNIPDNFINNYNELKIIELPTSIDYIGNNFLLNCNNADIRYICDQYNNDFIDLLKKLNFKYAYNYYKKIKYLYYKLLLI